MKAVQLRRVARWRYAGTPEYVAPEVAAGNHPASDLYGAGVILYDLLSGTTPFCGGTAIEIMRPARDPVIPPSERRPDRRDHRPDQAGHSRQIANDLQGSLGRRASTSQSADRTSPLSWCVARSVLVTLTGDGT